jgi:tape measure domain-containing protein
MSTLDRLKEKLNLSGASKGLENVGTAAKNVNMSGLSGAVETVTAKFSALQVMGVTALANITNSAVNAGKRMISALTIDPVKTGFSEYETKINAIQTIMSNTASKGTTMEDVTRVLNELNTYADKTIYNFAEMTKNIGTFTAAGVGLEESAAAIQGIANLAAASGSTSQQASTAMYQLSQALSSGTVKLMDWNSVVNAGMGGEKFQEALKSTAREYGVAVDDLIKKNGNFRESLHEEWITADILNTTLKKFTIDGAKEYAESMVKSGKYTQEQADALIKEAEAMNDAATKVKTFTQLWDTLKESAQSGWAQTWELIFGDFEEAKEFFSGLSDTLGGIINAASEARNKLLGGALGSKWDSFIGKVNEAGIETEKFEAKLKQTAKENGISIDELIEKHGSLANAIKKGAIPANVIVKTLKKFTGAGAKAGESTEELTEKLEYFQKVVDDVWRGDYGDGEDRVKALTEAGYEYAEVQALVNKTVDGHRLSIEELSDAELANIGYTEEQIAAIRKLAEEAEKSGTPINKLIQDLEKPSGRELLLGSLTNIIQGVIKACGALKDAWIEIFPPPTSDQIYNVIEAINKFTSYINISDETADKLRRTFKGIFAILDIILTIVGGPVRIAFKALTTILELTGYSLLDLTAWIGDGAVKLRDWIDSIFDVGAVIRKVIPAITNFGKSLMDWLAGIKDADNIPKYIIEGLVKGIKNGASKVFNGIIELGKMLIEKIKGVLGIHSPSTVFFEIGKNIIQGLVNGISDGLTIVWRAIKTVATTIIDYFRDVDLGQVIVTGMFAGMLFAIIKVVNTIGNLVKPLAGLGDMLEKAGDAIKIFSKGMKNMLNAKALEIKSRAMINMAIAIGILAASIYVLSKLEPAKLWSTVGALAVLALIITAMTLVVSKLGEFEKTGEGENVKKSYKMVVALIGIAGVLLMAALALKVLSTIDIKDVPTVLITLGAAIGSVAAILMTFGLFVKGDAAQHMDKAGKMLTKLSIALLLLVGVIKVASMLEFGEVVKGTLVVGALGVLMVALVAISNIAGANASKAGSMILKISLALLAAVAVIKLAGMLSPEEVIKGIFVMGLLGSLFTVLIAISAIAGKNASKAGLMLLLMSGAFLTAVGVIKIASMMEFDEVKKGIAVMGALSLLFAALIAISKLAGGQAHKAGIMFLAMSGALLILSGVMFILSKFEPDGLKLATVTMSILLALFGGIIAASHLAKDVKGTIIAMSIAIGIMTIALMALTFIDTKKVMTSVIALSVVMLSFAAMLTSLKSFKNKGAKMIPVILTMLGVVMVLTSLIMLLSTIDATAVLPSVASLSLLLLSMSTAMVILKKADGLDTVTIGKMALMGLIVAELGIIMGLLSKWNLDSSISTAISLGILLNAMAAAMVILKFVSPNAIAGIGALAVMGLVVAELGVILSLMSYFNVEPSIQTAISLSILLTAMSAALVILGVVGLMGPAAFIGVAALAVLIAGIGGLLIGIGALMDKFPQLEAFLDKGIPVLEKIGYALGSFFGNIVGGFIGGMASGLPTIADQLSAFMEHLQPFIEGAKSVDAKTMEGVKSLAQAILILTAADVLNGLTSWLTGGASLDAFGSQLPALGKSLAAFSASLEGFTEEDVNVIALSAEAIKKMAEAAKGIPNEGGWLGAIVGENSIAAFGEQLPKVGGYLNEFAKSLEGFTEDKVTTVGYAAEAVAQMAKAAQDIPNEGGWLAKIVGDNSISTFGSQLPQLGTNLSQFATNLGTFTPAQVLSISCAASAIKSMAQAASEIDGQADWSKKLFGDNSLATFSAQMPTVGTYLNQFATNLGTFTAAQVVTITCAVNAIKSMSEAASGIDGQAEWAKKLFGDNSLATFGEQMASVGSSLAAFAKNIGEFDSTKVATVGCAANAIKTMAQAASSIDGQAGWAKKLFGDNSIATFGKQMASVGTSLKNFAANLGSFDDQKVATINCAVNAIKTIAKLSGSNLKDLGKKLPDFGDKLTGLATDLKTFCTNMPGEKSIDTAVKNLQKVLDVIDEVTAANATAAKDFTSSLKTLGSDGVISFVNALKSSSSISSAKNATIALMNAAIKGVESKKGALKSAFKDSISASIESIKEKHTSFYSAGSYLVSGFCSGISENTYKAEAKARAMAKAAAKAAEEALDINSPSKVFANIGSGVVEGFVKGIDDHQRDSLTSVNGMAKTATRGFSDAIRQVSDLLDGDMDIQPTIRPVLDLSEVRSGAGSINSILNSRRSVGALATAGVISTLMNERNQNGANYEVVSAIKDLRKDFDKLGTTSYNINGITYDDGSNLANAIATIVREARIERRR